MQPQRGSAAREAPASPGGGSTTKWLLLVAAAAAGAAAAFTAQLLHWPAALTLAFLITPAVVAAGVIDARTGRIPNTLTAPLGAAVAAFALTSALQGWGLLLAALAGTAASMLFHGALWFLRAYGGGDLKLSISLTAAAATLGFLPAIVAVGAPSLLLLPVLITKRWILHKPLSRTRFGPYLAAAFILAIATALWITPAK